MSRAEFNTATRNAAWDRSCEVCEATGALYGLPPGERCTADLNLGCEYDHVILDANSKDNSLGNCAAVCPKCHRWKTTQRDIPTAAKTVRQRNMRRSIKPKGRGFQKAPPGYKLNWATGRMERRT